MSTTSQESQVLTIQTERLELRSLVEDDLEAILPILTNGTVMRWTPHGALRTRDQAVKWLSTKTPGPGLLVFAIRERLHGSVGQRIVGVMGSFGHPQAGYLLHPDFFGKGYATEALASFVPFYFDRVPPVSDGGQDILVANTALQNFASQRVLEKCGFTRGEIFLGLTDESTGLCERVVFRVARPGRSLQEMGMGAQSPRPI